MDPELRKQAACRGRPVNTWFPVEADDGTDNHGRLGKSYCKACPVWLHCLVLGLSEDVGIWGGFGENVRRGLKAKLRFCKHDPTELCDLCAWCRAVKAERDRLEGKNVAVVNRNTDKATCGRASTYGRNCRCDACTLAKAFRTSEDTYRKRERDVA